MTEVLGFLGSVHCLRISALSKSNTRKDLSSPPDRITALRSSWETAIHSNPGSLGTSPTTNFSPCSALVRNKSKAKSSVGEPAKTNSCCPEALVATKIRVRAIIATCIFFSLTVAEPHLRRSTCSASQLELVPWPSRSYMLGWKHKYRTHKRNCGSCSYFPVSC